MKSIERSVDSLQMIYAVIVALAIGKAIQATFIDTSTGLFKFDSSLFNYLPAFLTFVVTIVPFYHGMNRHLDKCYIENTERHVEGALLFDFLVFFFEASILFSFSTSIKSGLQSFLVLGVLLLVDIFWALISHWIHYRKFKPSVVRWSLINSGAIALGVFIYLNTSYTQGSKAFLLFVIAIIRSALDYGFLWRFYFPKPEHKV